MKKLVIALIATALALPVSAQAAETKFLGGPLTNLESTGATINVMLSNVPNTGGLYLMQCVKGVGEARPTICNKAAELWISTMRGASFLPTDTIKFKPTGTFMAGSTTIDCTVEQCGIFIRFDHTLATNLSEDQFIPLTFKAASSTTVVLPMDEITATINGVAVSTKAPITLSYRQLSTVAATSKAGAPLTFASLAPACALKGFEITPLTGVGECAISVTSAGNEKAAPAMAVLPIRLTAGVQTLGDFVAPKSAKVGKSLTMPSTTNFGELVSYKSSGTCTVKKAKVTFKKGKCTVTASALAKESSYTALNLKYVITAK